MLLTSTSRPTLAYDRGETGMRSRKPAVVMYAVFCMLLCVSAVLRSDRL
jgi:hypothetical protein